MRERAAAVQLYSGTRPRRMPREREREESRVRIHGLREGMEFMAVGGCLMFLCLSKFVLQGCDVYYSYWLLEFSHIISS